MADDEADSFVQSSSAMTIAIAATVTAVCVSCMSLYQHLLNYSCPDQQRHIIRLLFTCPLYAITSLLSLRFQEHAIYFETIRDCYESLVIYSFMVLILEYAGGEANCVAKMQGLPPLKPPFPCCHLDARPRTVELLRECKRGTQQFVVLKPTMGLLSIIMYTQGLYYNSAYQTVLLTVYNLSYTVALYYLLLFYLATKDACKRHSPVFKFASVKTVVFATYYQSIGIKMVPGLSAELADVWSDFILCAEMILFSMLLSCAFGAEPYETTNGGGVGGGLEGGGCGALSDLGVVESGVRGMGKRGQLVFSNARNAFAVHDVVSDTYHNFMPAYQDYVLQSGGDDADSGVGGQGGRGKPSEPRTVRRRTYIIGNIQMLGKVSGGGDGGAAGTKMTKKALKAAAEERRKRQLEKLRVGVDDDGELYFIGQCWGVETQMYICVAHGASLPSSACSGEGYNCNGFFSLKGTYRKCFKKAGSKLPAATGESSSSDEPTTRAVVTADGSIVNSGGTAAGTAAAANATSSVGVVESELEGEAVDGDELEGERFELLVTNENGTVPLVLYRHLGFIEEDEDVHDVGNADAGRKKKKHRMVPSVAYLKSALKSNTKLAILQQRAVNLRKKKTKSKPTRYGATQLDAESTHGRAEEEDAACDDNTNKDDEKDLKEVVQEGKAGGNEDTAAAATALATDNGVRSDGGVVWLSLCGVGHGGEVHAQAVVAEAASLLVSSSSASSRDDPGGELVEKKTAEVVARGDPTALSSSSVSSGGEQGGAGVGGGGSPSGEGSCDVDASVVFEAMTPGEVKVFVGHMGSSFTDARDNTIMDEDDDDDDHDDGGAVCVISNGIDSSGGGGSHHNHGRSSLSKAGLLSADTPKLQPPPPSRETFSPFHVSPPPEEGRSDGSSTESPSSSTVVSTVVASAPVPTSNTISTDDFGRFDEVDIPAAVGQVQNGTVITRETEGKETEGKETEGIEAEVHDGDDSDDDEVLHTPILGSSTSAD